jgi:hypothetical protein
MAQVKKFHQALEFATILQQPFPLPHYCLASDSSAVDESVMLTLLFFKIIYSTSVAFTSVSDVLGPPVRSSSWMCIHPFFNSAQFSGMLHSSLCHHPAHLSIANEFQLKKHILHMKT